MVHWEISVLAAEDTGNMYACDGLYLHFSQPLSMKVQITFILRKGFSPLPPLIPSSRRREKRGQFGCGSDAP